MKSGATLARALAVLLAVGVTFRGMAADEKSGKPPKPGDPDLGNLPGIIFDDSIGGWVVDRFAGNDKAGPLLYQGPAREIGGLGQIKEAVTTPDGTVYIACRGRTGRGELVKVTPDPSANSGLAVLDPQGIEIASCKAGVQENPRVAFFGDAFLVVWQDMRNGKDCDVLGARVSPEDKVLDEKPISIAAGPRTQAMPDVAADDQSFMVVWHGFQGDETIPRISAARVGVDGAAGAPAIVTDGSAPRIACNGKDYLVTCFDARRSGDRLATYTKYVCMDSAGKELFCSTYRENIAYAYSRRISVCGVAGKGWVLVCSRALPDFWGWSGPAAQRAYSITPEGKRADDSPSERYYDPERKRHVVPANWLDTSMGQETHRAAGPAGIPGIWPWGDSALAADGQYCLAVWQRYHTGGSTGIDMVNGDIHTGRVDGWKPLDGQGGVAVAASAASELNPALAGNNTGAFLCAYEKILDDGTKQICVRTVESSSLKARDASQRRP